MKFLLPFKSLTLLLIFSLLACEDDPEKDVLPKSFAEIRLKPDEIYVYNGDSQYGTRMDPLLNDTIKVEVTVSYSKPAHGAINFMRDEGWFYRPTAGFFGEDNVTYTVCHGTDCQTSSIKLYVEQPLDINDCAPALVSETVQTTKNQPVEIRVFLNDVVCPFSGWGMNSPDKGRYLVYSYSGGYKNTVYVYYPPANFVGTDQFVYRIFTNDGMLEATCVINVRP